MEIELLTKINKSRGKVFERIAARNLRSILLITFAFFAVIILISLFLVNTIQEELPPMSPNETEEFEEILPPMPPE